MPAHGHHVRRALGAHHGGVRQAARNHRRRDLRHPLGVRDVLLGELDVRMLLPEQRDDPLQPLELRGAGEMVPVVDRGRGTRAAGQQGCERQARCGPQQAASVDLHSFSLPPDSTCCVTTPAGPIGPGGAAGSSLGSSTSGTASSRRARSDRASPWPGAVRRQREAVLPLDRLRQQVIIVLERVFHPAALGQRRREMDADLEAGVAERDLEAVLGGEPAGLHHVADVAVDVQDVDAARLDQLALVPQAEILAAVDHDLGDGQPDLAQALEIVAQARDPRPRECRRLRAGTGAAGGSPPSATRPRWHRP